MLKFILGLLSYLERWLVFEGGVHQYWQYRADLVVVIKTRRKIYFFSLILVPDWMEVEIPELWTFLMVILAVSYV